ncbi:MAG: hypothetical protein JSW39_05995 [Desulfobacterales bacterium]|nr:MAG: hypothetical protein JSW39_05995 [Desulfobacterales bacterium]
MIFGLRVPALRQNIRTRPSPSAFDGRVFESYLTGEMVKGHIENFIGAVPIPLGLCGPIDIEGQSAKGRFVVSMATQEGTLVASYSRGAKIINACGGCETLVYDNYFLRGVQFLTASLKEPHALIEWCRAHEDQIRRLIDPSSCCVTVLDIFYECPGTTVMVSLQLDTGDAMGSNMATKAAGILSGYVAEKSGLARRVLVLPYPEDKKFIPVRQKGKKVIARTVLQEDILARITRTTLPRLNEFIDNSKSLLALHGAYALNVHVANGLAALFQALGQDVAYIAEGAQAVVESHFLDSGRLAVSVTLPALIVGTVGAATGLPAFKAALALMDCYGPGKANKLAEIIGAVILAGEIGCACAQCAFEFIDAHERMGKHRPLT